VGVMLNSYPFRREERCANEDGSIAARGLRAGAKAGFLLLLGAACLGSVQARAALPPETPQTLAATIDAHYNRLHSLSVHFAQAYDGMGMHRVETGTLLLTRGGRFSEGRMRWTYTQPAGKLFVFDGKYAYFYTPGQTEVQRVPAKELDDLRSPLALLLGHADLAKQLSGMTLTPGADAEATLAGIPKGLEQRVAQLRVTAAADGSIRSMVIDETDGSRNSFQFKDEEANAPAPSSDFVFTPPPGTHVVDGMPPI
jgi:outer membrane lipoprotein carrier protein